MNPIYTPSGRAKEYGNHCINIYTGCNHRCFYCFAPSVLHTPREKFHQNVDLRKDLLPSLERQLQREDFTGKLIHLCFTCDPYPAPPVDTTPTRQVIQMLKAAGCHVQILTKGGMRAMRDMDLLDGDDWFGVTLSGNCGAEPGAAPPPERILSLQEAYERGIKTWVSFEPVFDPEMVYGALRHAEFIRLFRIGKLNYYPSPINWAEFGRTCERLGEEFGREVYIKEDLRREMEKA